MAERPFTTDLERRKQVRIRIRSDLEITPHRYEGRTYHVLKDPVTLRYYRYTDKEAFLIQLLDGAHTLDQAQKRYEEHFRPDRLSLEELESLARQMLTAGMAHSESPQAGRQLLEHRQERRRNEWLQTLTNILYIKVPLFDPDRLLTRMLPAVRWMFTAWFGLLSLGIVLAAMGLVAMHFEAFRQRLPSYQEFFSLQTAVYLWLALGVVKVIHEFGHGLCCKAFGGEVHEMGALFLVFTPCLYCNVSDAWTVPSKWKRMIVGFAGIYVELMIAALATFVWWNTPGRPLINNLCLGLMIVCSVSTVVFNGNPLMRYDGYYVLFDWLEVPNLRQRSNRYLKDLVCKHGLGMEVPPEPHAMAPWRRSLFVAYALVSYIYRWVVTYSILVFLALFLKPYRLQMLSYLLACGALASMIGWPLYRLGQGLHQRGRLPEMKGPRIAACIAAIAAIVLCFFLVPLPVSRVRQTALIQFQRGLGGAQDAAETVFVPESGILEEVRVRDGQHVEKGQELAVFRDSDLWFQWKEACNERDIRAEELVTLTRLLDEARDRQPSSDGLSLRQIETTRADRDRCDGEARRLEQRVARLRYDGSTQRFVLRAPRAGIVMSPPQPDEIGKRWDRDQNVPFCTIGNPRQLRALMPLSPADYRLLREDLEESRRRGEDLAVTIRVQGQAERTWRGRIAQLPQSEAREIPLALTNRAGGPVAVKPGPSSGSYLPLSQQYLVVIHLEETDDTVCPGAFAEVKIDCRWRPCAWWLWRALASTFDLGLM